MMDVDGVCYYRIADEGQELLINPNKGATVRSWKVQQNEMVLPDKKVGALGGDRLYFPEGYMDSPELGGAYRFRSHDIVGGILESTFVLTIRKGKLAGVLLEKTFIMPKDGNAFELKYRFRNPQTEMRTIGFWIFNCPFALTKKDDAQPVLRFGDARQEGFQNSETLFSIAGHGIPDGYRRWISSIAGAARQPSPVLSSVAHMSNGTSSLRLEPDESVAQYYTWSSIKSEFITFEAIFAPQHIPAGGEWSTSMRFVAEK